MIAESSIMCRCCCFGDIGVEGSQEYDAIVVRLSQLFFTLVEVILRMR
jgi:hypothetical protein